MNALVLVAPSVPLSSSSLLPSITCKSSSLLRYLSSPCLLKFNANKCPGVEWYGGLVIENIVQTIYQWVLLAVISQYGTPAEPLHHVPAPSVVLSELVTAFLARGILSFL